ncbi:hypothetical protein EU805_10470 [Salipiger sp. IMCC34102]|uniref:hypothetical protein n=1 Tax=Salipiger sp. IMCC34102 TaxID=2510647 RepID=UPI00101D2651|nr:hypothetical protein [Salipiger sp. IMCC34102]RYH02266.1 hypothetical protein EU805_10470 [Salipiger sp. IMCC34102]
MIRCFVVAILAGIVGTIANSIAINIMAGAEVMPLILSFGRNAVAILIALLLIPIFGRRPGVVPFVLGVAVLTLLPSLLAKFVFGAEAPWGFVLWVNFIYALVATIIYAACYRKKR